MKVYPVLCCTLLLVMFNFGAFAQGVRPPQAPTGLPAELQGVTIDQRLNAQMPLDVTFRDEEGKEVRLGHYFKDKPVLLNFVYYECPMLCSQVLNGLVQSLKVLGFTPGTEFEVVTISFDPKDTPDLAREKKKNYLREYGRPGAEKGCHFLTGAEPSIKRATDAAGFHYKWIEKDNQFAHAAGIMIATPQGKLARYMYGIEFSSRDLRLALVEASHNKIGSASDKILLYCFHYDPQSGKYSAYVVNFVRAGAVLTIVGLGILVIKLNSSRKRKMKAGGKEQDQHVP